MHGCCLALRFCLAFLHFLPFLPLKINKPPSGGAGKLPAFFFQSLSLSLILGKREQGVSEKSLAGGRDLYVPLAAAPAKLFTTARARARAFFISTTVPFYLLGRPGRYRKVLPQREEERLRLAVLLLSPTTAFYHYFSSMHRGMRGIFPSAACQLLSSRPSSYSLL